MLVSPDLTSVFLLQLLSAASLFQLGVLQRHCELICSQHVNLDNAVSIYKIAKVKHTHTHTLRRQYVTPVAKRRKSTCLMKIKILKHNM